MNKYNSPVPQGTAPRKGKHGCLIASLIALALFLLMGLVDSIQQHQRRASQESAVTSSVSGNSDDSGVSGAGSRQQKTSGKTSEPPSITSSVIYEGNNVVITAKSLEETITGYKLNLLIENDSAMSLAFNAHAYAINGIMTGNNIYDMDCDVASGMKTNASLDLDLYTLDTLGISDIRCIDILFWAYDNSINFKAFDSGQVEIQTNLFNQKHDVRTGTSIYGSNGIRIDYLGHDGGNYQFSILNQTGSLFDFDVNDITVNGYTSSDLNPELYDVETLRQCQSIITIPVSDSFREQNGISTVDTIQWSMEIRPNGAYEQKYTIGPVSCPIP